MKTTHLFRGLALAAILAAPVAVSAQPAPAQPAPAAAPMAAPATAATYSARLERRISRLHTALGITPAQAGVWRGFADALRANGHDMDELVIRRRDALETMSALENLDSLNDIAAAHMRNMQRLKTAFAPLYAAMLPTQKANADKVLRARSLRSLGGMHDR
jgi:hypothetical protein